MRVECRSTFKRPTGGGAVFIDRASIVVAEKLAFSIDVRKHALDHECIIVANRHRFRKRRKPPPFIAA